jgi:16S rRNA (uracil1498-N3)-methyltransferase
VAIRLFVQAPLEAGALLTVASKQAHYLTNVMRRRAGDEVLLFDGRSGEWRARLGVSGRREVTLEVLDRVRAQSPEPGPALCFAPLKRVPQEFLVEKATELGVALLQPVLMQRNVALRVNLERLRAIAFEAAEQCGRLTLPAIEAPVDLGTVIARAAARPILWADEAAARRPAHEPAVPLLDALRDHGDADLLIGPEGGFDPDERALLLAAPGILRVSLGPRILRAETAAIAALACWQAVRMRRSAA